MNIIPGDGGDSDDNGAGKGGDSMNVYMAVGINMAKAPLPQDAK